MHAEFEFSKTMDILLPDNTKKKLLRIAQPGVKGFCEIDLSERTFEQLQMFFATIGEKLKTVPEWFMKKFYENLLHDLKINGRLHKDTVYALLKELTSTRSLSFANEKSRARATRKINEMLEILERWFTY